MNAAGTMLRVNEVAKKLSVSSRTVWRMIAEGQLKAVRVRGCRRIYGSSVAELLKENESVGCV